MTQVWLPPAEYYATRFKYMGAAGVIFRDAENQVLLVETTYGSETWEIPGGGIEADESPWQCARREITDELELEILPGRLLAHDWVPAQADGRPALANTVYDGGVLDEDQIASLRLTDGELKRWMFCTREEAASLLSPHLARRVAACLNALHTGQTADLVNGFDPRERGEIV